MDSFKRAGRITKKYSSESDIRATPRTLKRQESRFIGL
jgi:hypothetical protein